MKKFALLLLVCPMILGAQHPSIEEIKSTFKEPGNAWRGKPFWSWNGDLEKEELIRQIHVMKEMGMGGFFMHSRTGLKTEYLGGKWFDLINACADEAEKLGMEAWLYDEDRWPSGLAGGLVTQFPEYRAKLLTMHVYPPSEYQPDEKYLAWFSCRLDSLNCYDVRRVSAKKAVVENRRRTILAFFVREKESGSFYNGYTDVDRLSREATEFYFKTTHEQYARHCGDRMGTSIYGIFTDEPHRQGALRQPVSLKESLKDQIYLPWTGAFVQEFEKRMGYDLVDSLPALFLQPEGRRVAPVKWQYMEVAQELFLENWVIPYYEWCERNNLKFTGHFLHENNLTSQAAMQGSLMRSYEYMHYPGIDVLTEYAQLYWIAKQCQSVARQMGQPFILSELYGVTGWQFDFAGHKYVGDWQALFGVNLRCHHLSWYTMQGQAKRDYPASILHQSAWYKDYHHVETYFARLGYMLSLGQPDCGVLVVNPVESVWSRLRHGWARGLSPNAPDIQDLEKHYSDLFYALEGNQIDFDYGDEDMLMRHASIAGSPGGAALLKVGRAAYRTVVLGRMTTLRSSTLALLKAFAAAGGTIILAGDPPTHVDAVPSEAGKALLDMVIAVPFEKEEIARAVRAHTPIPIEAIDPASGRRIEDIYCQVKRDGDRTILVAMNMARETPYPEVCLRVEAKGQVTEWDCESGSLRAIGSSVSGGTILISTAFTGSDEHVYTITPLAIPGAVPQVPQKKIAELTLSGPYAYSLDEPNLCVLDMGYVEIDGQRNPERLEILKIDQSIRDHYGLPYRAGNMVQPWFKKKFHDPPERKGTVRISYPFYAETPPHDDLALCMETPGEFSISLNGEAIRLEDQGWWVDKAIRKFALPGELVRKGENILVQEFSFRDDLDIEAIYLLGDFAVRLEGDRKILGPLPEKISVGDLTGQGFPFYTGRVRYRMDLLEDYTDLGKVILELPAYKAACIKVSPDRQGAGIIAWPPNRLDVTEYLKDTREITIEAVLTRRNAFGPLHYTPFTHTTGPPHFTSTGEHFTNDYVLYPSGILEKPKLLIFR